MELHQGERIASLDVGEGDAVMSAGEERAATKKIETTTTIRKRQVFEKKVFVERFEGQKVTRTTERRKRKKKKDVAASSKTH